MGGSYNIINSSGRNKTNRYIAAANRTMKPIRQNRNKFKILGINLRPPAEPSGPFKGPSSYHQLCWWSLIILS